VRRRRRIRPDRRRARPSAGPARRGGGAGAGAGDAKAWTLVALEGDTATIDLHTSAGFYVRSLAHDVGAALGCGGHLAALRRTGSGRFLIDDAVALPAPDAPATALTEALQPMAALLPDWPAAVVTAAGAERVSHGVLIGPDACTAGPGFGAASPDTSAAPGRGDQPLQRPPTVRLVDEAGRLLALAVWRDGLLHPSVVLAKIVSWRQAGKGWPGDGVWGGGPCPYRALPRHTAARGG
jgi:tRNA pseudouridine55 synthase